MNRNFRPLSKCTPLFRHKRKFKNSENLPENTKKYQVLMKQQETGTDMQSRAILAAMNRPDCGCSISLHLNREKVGLLNTPKLSPPSLNTMYLSDNAAMEGPFIFVNSASKCDNKKYRDCCIAVFIFGQIMNTARSAEVRRNYQHLLLFHELKESDLLFS